MSDNDLLPIWPKPKRPVVEIDNSGETDVTDILQGYLDGRWDLAVSDNANFLSGGSYLISRPLSIKGCLCLESRVNAVFRFKK